MKAVSQTIPSVTKASAFVTRLIYDLSPPLLYWRFIKDRSADEFWRDEAVFQLLSRVFQGSSSMLRFSISLGVTPEMVLCNLLGKPSNPRKDVSESSLDTIPLPVVQFNTSKYEGKKQDFWKNEIVREVMTKLLENSISAEVAGEKLGIQPEVLELRVKRIRTAERERKRRKLSLMEQQVDREEERLENDEELSDYEKMRLENMRRKLEVFQQLQIDMAKSKCAPPKPAKPATTAKELPPPRQPSARIQGEKEKRKSMEQTQTAIPPEKLMECPVPPVPLILPEILAINVSQPTGRKVLAGIQTSLNAELQQRIPDPRSAGVKKIIMGATPSRITCSAATVDGSNLLAFGDEYGSNIFLRLNIV